MRHYTYGNGLRGYIFMRPLRVEEPEEDSTLNMLHLFKEAKTIDWYKTLGGKQDVSGFHKFI